MMPPLTEADTLAVIHSRGRAVWPGIVKERQARAALEVPAPPKEEVKAPATKESTKAEVFAGWSRTSAEADRYGLLYEKLTMNASPQRMQANGKALAETIAQVEADIAKHKLMVEVMQDIGQPLPAGFEFAYDKVGDPLELHRMVEEFGGYVDELRREAAGEGGGDPFAKEAA
jgi:hypothetical protein